jgi:hypothetical protein
MKYVICPQCSDPVAGAMPPAEFTLTCVHCKHTFPFDAGAVRSGLVVRDEKTDRWKLAM